ncbi:MAG: hypothetical protein HY319_06155 [Armatimonadetes bacterium]|nr:hypothetical protein [Armatimonadota bacterium]
MRQVRPAESAHRRRGRAGQRGVSLILALFTTVVLLTLSIAFIALAIGNARTSRTASYASVAQNAANWGIEYAINYMGVGDHWATSFSGLTPVHQLVVAADQVHPAGGDYEADVVANGNTRELVVENSTVGGGAALRIGTGGDAMTANVQVDVAPIVLTGGAGQIPNYQLVATSQVFNAAGVRVATRVVEVRVREGTVTDSLHFIQNGRAWDAMGVDFTNAATAAQMADRVRIPPTYVEDGPMSIVGGGAVPATTGNLHFIGPYPGPRSFTKPVSIQQLSNMYSGPGSYNDGAATGPGGFFEADLIPDKKKPLPETTSYLNTDKNGNGRIDGTGGGEAFPTLSFNPADPEERGVLYAASRFDVEAAGGPTLFTNGSDQGYYKIDPEEVVIRRPTSTTPQIDDYRPGIPQIEVELNGDQVTVFEHTDVVNDPTGASRQMLQTYDLGDGDLPNRVLYVEGGNVVVHSRLNGQDPVPFDGDLTVVATGNPANEPISVTDGVPRYDASAGSDTMYNWIAREMLEYEKLQPITVPADFNPPPYTADELRTFNDTVLVPAGKGHAGAKTDLLSNNGGITDPSWKGGSRCFYPPPAQSTGNTSTLSGQAFNNATDREGNLIVASDIKYNNDPDTIVGLLSENFILLNDHTTRDVAGNADDGMRAVYGAQTDANKADTLEVDAVLFSFEHSVQFDWDNTALNSPDDPSTPQVEGLHGQLIQPRADNALRQFLYNGSVIGGFLDTEGDTSGRGYENQDFSHDPKLKNRQPPFLPRFDFDDFEPGVQITWVIRHYVDRGALSTENSV